MGNDSFMKNDTLMTLFMHNNTIVIYIQDKFHEIRYIGYLVMAEDRQNH